MPNLSWCDEDEQQAYLDAFRELVLPQTRCWSATTSTLCRLLLPDWNSERPPSRATSPRPPASMARRYVLVTGVPAARPVPRQRARHAAGRDHRREVRALRSHLRRRRRHAVGRAGGAAGQRQPTCTPRSARRWPSSTGASTRASAPAWATSCPTASSGPCPRGEDEAPSRRSRARRSRGRCRAARPAPCPLSEPSTSDRRTQQLFERARSVIPGGVNSPVRAFRAVGGTPRFIARAQGAVLLGRRRQALHRLHRLLGADDPGPRPPGGGRGGAARGRRRASPSARRPSARSSWPRRSCALVPSVEQVRLVSSGTEAAMSALRLARGATGRSKIVKFEGCYHGHADALLVKAGSGLATFGHPTSAGVPRRSGAAHAGARIQQRRAARGGLRAARRASSPA